MSFVIRHGVKQDVAGILKLIKELAEFERAPQAVINTQQTLAEDGFGKETAYRVIVAEDLNSNDIIGMALYFTAYSTWKGRIFYLDDLVVTESYRRYGVGEKLIEQFLKDASEAGVQQVRWQVLEWNKPAIKFYEKIGAEFDPEWINCRMTREQIKTYIERNN